MLKLIITFTFLFAGFVQASRFEDYLQEKRVTVSDERHLPYLLTHGHKTPVSVLLVHGIYSSPHYFRSMAQAYFNSGYNVVTVILPGHWEKDFKSMDTTNNYLWSKEVDRGYEMAKELGDKIILSGHSLGGLLSIEQALKRPPSEVGALVVISPSLKVWGPVLLACKAGRGLGLSGNVFMNSRPNGTTIPYFAPSAGPMIQGLADRVLTKPIKTPIFMAWTHNDNVVDVTFLSRFYKRLTAPKKSLVYGLFSGISHGDISQGPLDRATYGNITNHDFDRMMGDALAFTHELGL